MSTAPVSTKLFDVPDIVLTTLNARYAHAAFGLRYLMANLGGLRSSAKMLEFDINQRPIDVLEAILAEKPKIVGVGVYIWNAQVAEQLVMLLKKIRTRLGELAANGEAEPPLPSKGPRVGSLTKVAERSA